MQNAPEGRSDDLYDTFTEFEAGVRRLNPSGEILERIGELVIEGRDLFSVNEPRNPDMWLGLISYGAETVQQVLATHGSAAVVVRALERYIENNKPRKNIRTI